MPITNVVIKSGRGLGEEEVIPGVVDGRYAIVRLIGHFVPSKDTANKLAVRYVTNVLYERKSLTGGEPLIEPFFFTLQLE